MNDYTAASAAAAEAAAAETEAATVAAAAAAARVADQPTGFYTERDRNRKAASVGSPVRAPARPRPPRPPSWKTYPRT